MAAEGEETSLLSTSHAPPALTSAAAAALEDGDAAAMHRGSALDATSGGGARHRSLAATHFSHPHVGAGGVLPAEALARGSEEGFGKKTIDMFGSVAFLVNGITGPGMAFALLPSPPSPVVALSDTHTHTAMVSIPVIYAEAGWFFPTVVFLVGMVASSFCGTMLAEAMSLIPGNVQWDKRIEYPDLVMAYTNRRGFWVAQIFVNISLHAMNVASIIVTGQVMDVVLIKVLGESCGLQLYPHVGWQCVHEVSRDVSPFGPVFIITLGYFLCLVLILPISFLNLDENIWIQKLSAALMIFMVLIWLITFFRIGLKYPLPAFGGSQRRVIGHVLFNYAFVITVPSWVNEKKAGVSVNKAIWSSNILSTILFIAVGVFGAMSFRFTENGDLLSSLEASGRATWIEHFAVVSFPVLCVLPSIPILSIIVRYNLISNDIASRTWASIFGIAFPWAVSLVFYTGAGLGQVINWTSLVFNSVIDFVVPFWLFIRALSLFRQRLVMGSEDSVEYTSEGTMADRFRNRFKALPDDAPIDPRKLAGILLVIMAVLCGAAIILNIYALLNAEDE